MLFANGLPSFDFITELLGEYINNSLNIIVFTDYVFRQFVPSFKLNPDKLMLGKVRLVQFDVNVLLNYLSQNECGRWEFVV